MISVCIATYNGEKFIKEQLDSILHQLSDGDEIIISDDSSTDATLDIIKKYLDKRIVIIDNQKFHSPVYNFENAIKQAKGDYIFLADQDDVWLPHKIDSLLPHLVENDLVLSNAKVVDASLSMVKERFYKKNPLKGFISNFSFNPYTGCMLAINRRALRYILPFPPKIAMHDIWIGLCCEIFGKVYFLDENLILYRRHGANLSAASETSVLPYTYRITYRMIVLKELMKRYAKIKFRF